MLPVDPKMTSFMGLMPLIEVKDPFKLGKQTAGRCHVLVELSHSCGEFAVNFVIAASNRQKLYAYNGAVDADRMGTMQRSAIPQGGQETVLPLESKTLKTGLIRVRQIQHPRGQGLFYSGQEHTLFMSLAPKPVRLLHRQAGLTSTGLYGRGDMVITPAKTSLAAQWDDEDHVLQVCLADGLLKSVAQETLGQEAGQVELQPTFRVRDPQIEAIAMMLLAEHQGPFSSQLYVDSLANVLVVNLLRNYGVKQSNLPIYEGGLPQGQLGLVLDYLEAHLDQELKLVELAKLVGMSQFHFCRLFKQSMGLSPYQYLLQQRVERAKHLLKGSELLIADIAMDCGFSSHSHLSRQFRRLVGVTPKAYRLG